MPIKVQFSRYIQPVLLPKTCETNENIEVIAMGNGATSNTGTVSPQLQFAVLKTLPVKTCRKEFPFLFWRKSVTCAIDVENGQSVCMGDSGGPLVRASDRTLIGISSFIKPGKRLIFCVLNDNWIKIVLTFVNTRRWL